MATSIYVAIDDVVDRTGTLVTNGGGATYSATFATIALAIADLTYGVRDLVVLDEKQYYDQFVNLTATIDFTADWTTDLVTDNNIVCRTEPSLRHNGVRGTGLTVVASIGYAGVINTSETTDVDLAGLDVENTHLQGYGMQLGGGARLTQSFLKSTQDVLITSGRSVYIESCGIVGNSGRGIYIGNYDTAYVNNCVVRGCTIGVGTSDLGIEGNISNTICVDNGTDFNILEVDMVQENNTSSDTTAANGSAINPIINIDPNVIFKDYANDDLHLSIYGNTNPMFETGVDKTGIVVFDIDFESWVAPYSRGMDYGEAFVPTLIKNISINGHIPYVISVGVERVQTISRGTTVVWEAGGEVAPIKSGVIFNPQDTAVGLDYYYDGSECFYNDEYTPITYEIIGLLPDGLIIEPTSGIIHGVPTTIETVIGLDIRATNTFGTVETTDSADIEVADPLGDELVLVNRTFDTDLNGWETSNYVWADDAGDGYALNGSVLEAYIRQYLPDLMADRLYQIEITYQHDTLGDTMSIGLGYDNVTTAIPVTTGKETLIKTITSGSHSTSLYIRTSAGDGHTMIYDISVKLIKFNNIVAQDTVTSLVTDQLGQLTTSG